MSDDERIEHLELEIKVLRANNKGLKDKINVQSKEIEALKLIQESYKEMIEENNYINKDKIKEKIKWYEDFRGSVLYEKYNYEEFVKDLQSLLEKE